MFKCFHHVFVGLLVLANSYSQSHESQRNETALQPKRHHHEELLEGMMFKFSTDKSRDDHAYVNFYSSIWDHSRTNTMNVTEIGVAGGFSLQVWTRYFPKAAIWGIDPSPSAPVVTNANYLPNIHLLNESCLDKNAVEKLHFSLNSMDIIIDDGPHEREKQEVTLRNFWKYLKPGGLYIIEDVDGREKGLDFTHHPEKLGIFTREVLKNHTAYLVDTTLGHRDWNNFNNKRKISRYLHNSLLLVVRKRDVSPDYLESLMQKDVGQVSAFSKVYSSLWEHQRHTVTHVAEVGEFNTSYWSHYFPNATIVGLTAPSMFVGLNLNKFDMIVDHGPVDQQKNLRALWDCVRPGGFYVMEFLSTHSLNAISKGQSSSSRGLNYLHRPETLDAVTAQILQNNFPFFVDTSIGRQEWGFQVANEQQPQRQRPQPKQPPPEKMQQQQQQQQQRQRQNFFQEHTRQQQHKPQQQPKQQSKQQQLRQIAIQQHQQQQKYQQQQPPQRRRRLRQCTGVFDWAWSFLTGIFTWSSSDLTGNCNWWFDGTGEQSSSESDPYLTYEIFGRNPAASFCIVIRKRIGSSPPIKNIGGSKRIPFLETMPLSSE